MSQVKQLITVSEAAERIGIAPGMLYKKSYRLRIGLRACRIGRRLLFRPTDIDEVIERSFETLPIMPSSEVSNGA